MQVQLKRTNKTLLIVGAALLLVMASIGGTLAWLTAQTNSITNTFTPGAVPIMVVENGTEYSGGYIDDLTAKENVYIKNTGNVPAYIRVALVPVWRNDDMEKTGTGLEANLSQCAISPELPTGSTPNDNKWFFHDGYYYYSEPVYPAGTAGAGLTVEQTKELIDTCTVSSGLGDAYIDKLFELQVLAQSIQAEGLDSKGKPPVEVWGVTVSDGKLVPLNP